MEVADNVVDFESHYVLDKHFIVVKDNLFHMNTPIVSVVLCTYNDEKYIERTIDSVLSQTYSDFEFIIWNDGSTDKTESIVKSYHDERIRYYYHENTGLGIALSLACKEAKGKYIARIDGDDICMPDRFAIEVAFLESHPEYVLASSSVLYIDENDKIIGRSFPWTWDVCLRKRRSVVHPATMFRKEAYDMTCGYLGLSSAQDRVLWSKLVAYGKIKNIKQPLIKYRMMASSISHSFNTNGDYAKMLNIIREKMGKDLLVNPQDVELHNLIYTLAKKEHASTKEYNYRASLEEKLYGIMKTVIGSKMSENLVYFMRNLYMFFLLKAWK